MPAARPKLGGFSALIELALLYLCTLHLHVSPREQTQPAVTRGKGALQGAV